MATPFLGEIKIVSFNFPPKGWAFANGQLLPINQNQALFSLYGTTYGGNGQTNFALPNLQGRAPIHFGSSFSLGEAGGQTAHTLTIPEMPAHNHFMMGVGTNTGNVNSPNNAFFAGSAPAEMYSSGANPSLVTLDASTVGAAGGSQPHENMQPYLALNFIVALQGIFPSPA